MTPLWPVREGEKRSSSFLGVVVGFGVMYPKIAITEARSSRLDTAKESGVGESGGGEMEIKFPRIGFFSTMSKFAKNEVRSFFPSYSAVGLGASILLAKSWGALQACFDGI